MTEQEIRDGAPSGATHYSNLDGEIAYYQVTNNILYWDDDYKIWDEVYFDMPDLKPIP